MATEQTTLTEDDLRHIETRLKIAGPPNKSDPSPYDWYVLDVGRLLAEVRRLKRELSIKDSLIGHTAPEMQTITIATEPPDVRGLIACTRCGRLDGSLVNIPGTTPGWVCADKCVRPWWNQGEVSSL